MKTISASAPGYLVLMGEHAVLHGRPALVAAIDQRITVTITPRDDSVIHIDSPLGIHQTTLDNLTAERPFQFVLGALEHHREYLMGGLEIHITSDLPDSKGFGSSTAVTVATVCALRAALDLPHDNNALFKTTQAVVHEVQGMGSGADVAASIYGGIVLFSKDHIQPVAHQNFPPLHAYYCGYKTPTAEVIKKLAPLHQANPDYYDAIYQDIAAEVAIGRQAIEAQDWVTLGQAFNRNQMLLKKLGVSDATLDNMCSELQADPAVFGAKISGAGLGDSVIAIGKSASVHIATQGVMMG